MQIRLIFRIHLTSCYNYASDFILLMGRLLFIILIQQVFWKRLVPRLFQGANRFSYAVLALSIYMPSNKTATILEVIVSMSKDAASFLDNLFFMAHLFLQDNFFPQSFLFSKCPFSMDSLWLQDNLFSKESNLLFLVYLFALVPLDSLFCMRNLSSIYNLFFKNVLFAGNLFFLGSPSFLNTRFWSNIDYFLVPPSFQVLLCYLYNLSFISTISFQEDIHFTISTKIAVFASIYQIFWVAAFRRLSLADIWYLWVFHKDFTILQ